MNAQCYRLVATFGEPPKPYRIGLVARFRGEPAEAAWNSETNGWVPLRWEKCDDPREVSA